MHFTHTITERRLRERQILALIPVSRSTLWRWVDEGRFPKPLKLAPGVTVWHEHDVLTFLQGGER